VKTTMVDVVMAATQGMMGRQNVHVKTIQAWYLVTVVKCVFHLTTHVHQINLCVWMVNVWVRDGFVIHRMIAMTTRMRTLIFVVSLNNFMVTHVDISSIFFLNSLKWFFDGSMEIEENHHPWSWKSKWFVTYYNWRAVVFVW
jgi:hypothetical protein